jgi:hypothetical protein
MSDDLNSPEAHGWRKCDEKPVQWQSVHVMLPDGTARVGFWNGVAWVVAGAQVEAVYWCPLNSSQQ